MSEVAIMLLLSGWHCPQVTFAEIYCKDEYLILCVNGEPTPPVTGPFDGAVRVDIDAVTCQNLHQVLPSA